MTFAGVAIGLAKAFIDLALFGGAAGLVFWKTLRATFTERPSDVTTIKAHYEGLVGLAGTNMTVVSVRRVGTQPAGRSDPPARKYEVVLKRLDGRESREVVGVSAGFFDDGNLVEVFGGKRRILN